MWHWTTRDTYQVGIWGNKTHGERLRVLQCCTKRAREGCKKLSWAAPLVLLAPSNLAVSYTWLLLRQSPRRASFPLYFVPGTYYTSAQAKQKASKNAVPLTEMDGDGSRQSSRVEIGRTCYGLLRRRKQKLPRLSLCRCVNKRARR